MDLSDLRIFTAVVSEGGITRAAQRLHRVQSNITTRVRQLENELGVSLFLREGKRMQLTAEGRTLLTYAEKLLGLAQEASDAIRSPHPRGIFRIGAMESTAAVRLPAPLHAYHAKYPDVVIELRTGNPHVLSKAVLADEIDAAFVAEPVATAQFDSVPVFAETMAIIAAKHHPKIGARSMPTTLIAFEHGCPHRSRMEQWYARRNAMPQRIVEMSSYHAMLGCVLAGMGVSLLPMSVLATFPERKRLEVYPAREFGLVRTLLIWRKGARSANIDALLRTLDAPAGSKAKG